MGITRKFPVSSLLAERRPVTPELQLGPTFLETGPTFSGSGFTFGRWDRTNLPALG